VGFHSVAFLQFAKGAPQEKLDVGIRIEGMIQGQALDNERLQIENCLQMFNGLAGEEYS